MPAAAITGGRRDRAAAMRSTVPAARAPPWLNQFFAYFASGGANNGGTEAMHGITELHPGIARSSRNPTSHRLRMDPA